MNGEEDSGNVRTHGVVGEADRSSRELPSDGTRENVDTSTFAQFVGASTFELGTI